MLRKGSWEEIEQNLDFAYSLAMDQTRSGYPLYADGIKTREDFVQSVKKCFSDENSEVLLFELEGRVEGLIQFYYLAEDRYLQTEGFSIARHTDTALAEFLDYARVHFSGYELYLGFPKRNAVAGSFLRKQGWECVEELCHNIIFFDQYSFQTEPGDVEQVTRVNFPAFQEIHDNNRFWNSDRLFQNLDSWDLYLYSKDKRPMGTLFMTAVMSGGEIFGVDYRDRVFDRGAYAALMARALNDCKRRGKKYLIYLDDPKFQSAAAEMGFTCVGEYMLFVGQIE